MRQHRGLLLLSMVVMILFLAKFLHYTPIIFADHGQEVSITLDSGQFIPLTSGEGNQINAFLNYIVNDPSIVNQRINSIMKIYWPNQTIFKTSSSPDGFIINETGSQRHATTITNGKLTNPIAVIQFADLTKTMPLSNSLQITLALNQSAVATQEQAVDMKLVPSPPS